MSCSKYSHAQDLKKREMPKRFLGTLPVFSASEMPVPFAFCHTRLPFSKGFEFVILQNAEMNKP